MRRVACHARPPDQHPAPAPPTHPPPSAPVSQPPSAGLRRPPTIYCQMSKQGKVIVLSWLATLADTGRPDLTQLIASIQPGKQAGRGATRRGPLGRPGALIRRVGAASAAATTPPKAQPPESGMLVPASPIATATAAAEAPAKAETDAVAAAVAPAGAASPRCLIGPAAAAGTLPGSFPGYREFYLAEVEPAFPEEGRCASMRPVMELLAMHCKREVGWLDFFGGGCGVWLVRLVGWVVQVGLVFASTAANRMAQSKTARRTTTPASSLTCRATTAPTARARRAAGPRARAARRRSGARAPAAVQAGRRRAAGAGERIEQPPFV
jgi:hypothetical protein